MESLRKDIRYAVRMLAKNPGFTLIGVFTLALGIAASTALFSVVYGVLLRPLPYPKPSQIVRLWEVDSAGNRMNFADPNFEDIRSQNHSLQGVAEYGASISSVLGGTQPTRTMIASVSRDFFSVLGVQPVLGRGFAPEDQRFGAAPAVLVSYGYWKQYLGGGPDLPAIRLAIETRPASVVGVLPPRFRFPDEAEIWMPRELFERLPSRSAHNWHVIGRLRDGAALSQAHAELSTIARRLKQQYGQDTMTTDVAVATLQDSLTGRVRPALLILLSSAGFLLLIACANVANLLLAQAATRERELAIRAALGAERGRLVRQFLTEALLLSLAGGALGVFTALWGVNALLAIAPHDLPRLEEVSVNLPVLLFALGISVAVAAGLGVSTALRATSGSIGNALAEGGQRHAGTLRSQRLGRAIVAGQLAITLVLLVGAGLLGRSLLRVLSVDPGFQTERVVTMDLALPGTFLNTEKAPRAQFLSELFARLRGIPGVEEVGGTNALPLAAGMADGSYVLMNPEQISPHVRDLIKRSAEGSLESDQALVNQLSSFFDQLFRDPTHTGEADYAVASEGYFRALGIPLLRGRLFDDRDTRDAPHAALISESLARQRWPNEDPLGHSIEFGNMDGDLRLLTVVGVVGDVREASLEAPPRPTIYVNYRQRPQSTRTFSVVLRTGAEPGAVISAAREIVRQLDPSLPPRFNTYTRVIAGSLESRRFSLTLAGIFAATALLLATAGIYGVTAYSVTRRTREIGVRVALGARGLDVLRLVLGQGMVTAVIGVAIGVCGACLLTRAMQSLLFGVTSTDPLTFAAVALLLVLVALLASFIPARRAMRVDPLVALRDE